jgi:hypothetical protein
MSTYHLAVVVGTLDADPVNLMPVGQPGQPGESGPGVRELADLQGSAQLVEDSDHEGLLARVDPSVHLAPTISR